MTPPAASPAHRVWLVSELYYPEDAATGYIVTCIAEGLAPFYDVRVLCSQPTYEARGKRAPAFETRRGVRIHRCAATTLPKDILLLRLINIVTISVSIFLNALFRMRSGDTVIVVTNPPLLPFILAAATRLRAARCVLLVHDVYPEVLVRTGFLSENSWITRGLSWCSKWLYERMERVIVIGRDMQELVAARLDDAAERIVLIPNFGDRDQIVPTPKDTNGVLEQLGLRDKFVVQYSGNLGRTHGLNHVMEAAQRLEQTSDVHFLFIGAGAMRNWILATCERLAIRNVSVLGYVQRNELTVSLNACDVSLVSFAQGMAGVSVPSRMYNILAAGKPIIAVADESSELARVVREAEVGWVVPPGQPDLIAAAVLEAQRSPERLIEMGLNARRASEQFTLARVVASYRNLIDDVAGPLPKRDVDPLPFSDQAAPPPPERAPAYSEPGTVAPR